MRRLLAILEKTGLAPLAFALYERWQTRGGGDSMGSEGQRLPPVRLRFKVAGTANAEHFLDGGRKAAESLRALLAAHGQPLEGQTPVLDFGCGCGRVLLHLKGLAELYGCDYNPELVRWCTQYLPGALVVRNNLAPPLPFETGQFRLVYALSVFTHMPEDLAGRWMAEMQRVLAPGGFVAFSTHGEHYLPLLGEKERQTFLSGMPVVRFRNAAGANLCSAYHPRVYVERVLARGLEPVAYEPRGALGNPQQDLYLFRKPGG